MIPTIWLFQVVQLPVTLPCMRREDYRMSKEEAVGLLERAPVVHVASTLPDGEPVLRTVHGVVVDGAIAFHGAPAGEKAECVGRPAVISAEEIVAPLPSYVIDKERACPATTLYLGVQVHGVLEEVRDPEAKARVLRKLMARFQPEGGYRPIDPADPMYRRAVEGLLVVRVPLERVDGKGKLAQNRRPEERGRILELLWKRGLPGDPRAIELIRDICPDTPLPAVLRGPPGVTLHCHLERCDAEDAAALLEGTYWNEGVSPAALERAHCNASAWVGARDAQWRLIGSARAMTDGAKWGWIYDVIVAPEHRRKGLGRALVALLLDHPALRGALRIKLATRDAQALYAGFGFRDVRELPPRPYASTEMALVRG
jgi:GNAT superfamily N-acetyltransferase/nitroimidazol reductase NimA-like FMN-containing flavoprotein (pyridoxamine 5'-phosphate oxidase superfamily)